ncbi:DUF697 domain-containing protein [Candidatus Gracilibacteria bacterium 28_42_T64]|nr:DUF697 domain-containing protein [Candidatus Gracilibacteria bacterium 28_42_T64]
MKHIDSINGAVLFTDIKDFTLKTSLMTQVQINTLLSKQDEIIFPIIKKYFGKIVKSIGDSYMIVFEKPENALQTSIEIQKKLEKYNSQIELNLYKIELRISADYGSLEREVTINGEDYFGDSVNVASRLQNKTPENKIFISGGLWNAIQKKNDYVHLYLGKTSFKGVLYEVDIYEIVHNLQEVKNIKEGKIQHVNINDYFISEDFKTKIKKIDDTIFKFSSVAAILGVQPIPFLDTYSVLPFHLYLLQEISHSYGIELNKDESKEIFTTILSSVGGSYVFSQTIVGITKLGFVGFGGYLMIPLNFGLTYSIGKVLSYYFYKKSQGVKATNKELKTLFSYSVKSGKEIAKRDKNKIINIGKKYKKTFIETIKKYSSQKNKTIIKVKNIFTNKK